MMSQKPGEEIRTVDSRITVLPDPDHVFSAEQPWLNRLAHPLLSVDLSRINQDLQGHAHILSPIEPADGLLGENTSEFWNDYSCENWIAFHLDENNKYHFLGDRRFFEIEGGDSESSGPVSAEIQEYLSQLYTEAEKEISGARVRWQRLQALVWGDYEDPTIQRADWGTDIAVLDQLGGEPGYGNWTSFPPPPAFTLNTQNPVSPVLQLKDGSNFTFIGQTAGYPWRHTGADSILLFFEPKTRTAVLTFDWS